MGRGRAKAKQTKIARQLKYADHGEGLTRLAAELGAVSATGRADDATQESGGDEQDLAGQQ